MAENRTNEMGNLLAKHSDLATDIWINDKESNHSRYYVKIVPRKDSPKKTGYEMSISDDPVFLKTTPTLKDLNMESWELEQIKQWIKDNYSNLRRVVERSLTTEKMLALTQDYPNNDPPLKKYVPPKTKLELRSMRDGTSVVTGPTSPTPEPVAESFLQYARKRMLNKQRIEFGLPPVP